MTHWYILFVIDDVHPPPPQIDTKIQKLRTILSAYPCELEGICYQNYITFIKTHYFVHTLSFLKVIFLCSTTW